MPMLIGSKTTCRREFAKEKSNHVSYPVPSVRKYEFVALNLSSVIRATSLLTVAAVALTAAVWA